ncbi:MAG: IS200/IS605 family transposase [Gemmataceae bacterium]|nr:IS200/IS605 family transposase [Gemmataceae bacterium]
MPQSFAAAYLHFVFNTKNREPWIEPAWADRLYGYFGGIAKGNKQRLLIAGGMPDHAHLLVSIGREDTIAGVVGTWKSGSSRWVHDTIPHCAGFAWQSGYGAFSVSQSQLEVVTNYIRNQAEHHAKTMFQQEYRAMLRKHEIAFDERYVWD